MKVEFVVFWILIVADIYVERRVSFKTNKGAGVLLNLLRNGVSDVISLGIDYVVDGEILDTYDPDEGHWDHDDEVVIQ